MNPDTKEILMGLFWWVVAMAIIFGAIILHGDGHCYNCY
jgi:hypothetical protein